MVDRIGKTHGAVFAVGKLGGGREKLSKGWRPVKVVLEENLKKGTKFGDPGSKVICISRQIVSHCVATDVRVDVVIQVETRCKDALVWIVGVAGRHCISVTIDAILWVCAYLALLASVTLYIENLVGFVFGCTKAIACREAAGVVELAEEAHLFQG